MSHPLFNLHHHFFVYLRKLINSFLHTPIRLPRKSHQRNEIQCKWTQNRKNMNRYVATLRWRTKKSIHMFSLIFQKWKTKQWEWCVSQQKLIGKYVILWLISLRVIHLRNNSTFSCSFACWTASNNNQIKKLTDFYFM